MLTQIQCINTSTFIERNENPTKGSNKKINKNCYDMYPN